MKINNLKAYILVPLALASVVLLVLFVFGVNREHKEHLAEDLVLSAHATEEYYRLAFAERAYKLNALIEVIAADPALKSALRNRNREALLNRTLPIFQRLKAEHSLTHFYVHDQQRVNILRLHQPDRHGDKVDRFAVISAEKNRDFFHALELEKNGIFTLRAVQPIYEQGELIGYIELGEEIDQLFQELGEKLDVDVIVVVNKLHLHQSDWATNMAANRHTMDWDQFPDFAVVSHASRPLLNELRDQLSYGIDRSTQEGVEINLDGKKLRGRILALPDAGERNIGAIIVLRDITSRMEVTQSTIALVFGSVFALSLTLFLVLYFIINKVEKQQKAVSIGLQEKEHELARIIESVPNIIYMANPNDRFSVTFVSPAITQLLGYTPDEFIGDPTIWDRSIHQEDRDRVRNHTQSVIASSESDYYLKYRMWHKNGKRLCWFDNRVHIVRDSTGSARLLFGVMTDISQHKNSEVLAARMGRIFQHSWNEIYTFDVDTLRFVEVSEGARQNLGYSHEELRQLTPLDLKPEYTVEQFETLIEPLRRAQQNQVCFETEHRRKNGSQYPVEVRLQLSDMGESPVFIAIIQDISERKKYIEELERKALYDALTELPNRSLLKDRLNHSLKVSHRTSSCLCVAVLNILRFKEINNLLGHDSGDVVIKEAASRLQKLLRETDTVARLDGDQFGILFPSVNIQQAEVVIRKIQKAFQEPIYVEDMPLELDVAIGIAQHPDHGDSPEVLLKNADIAMRVAKKETSHFSIYNASEDTFSVRRLKLQGEIRRAISDKEITVYYQPKINLNTGHTSGVEALARWPHPTEGMVSPDEFIPLVEQSGMIRLFTLLVLDQSIKQIKGWADNSIDLSVAVNLSTRNLIDPTLADSIHSLLNTYQVNPDRLTLEVTESVIMSHPEQSLKTLNEIHALGVKISIDDFGNGYSSLTYLKDLPARELKIDRYFISAISGSDYDKLIVRSTIDLAHKMGLSVVAEGVESLEVVDLLRAYSCDFAQGYYFCPPLPAQELERWLAESRWGLLSPA